jgi:UDP-N-acetylmuramoylalanine-D-glutamate ligase
LEYVKTINGIDFINDSRSINSNAVWYALESMTKPITWIMNINNQEELTEALLDSILIKLRILLFKEFIILKSWISSPD